VTDAASVLVLGVGNVFYGDEGAGVHAVHYLRRKYRFEPHVDVEDGGTLGWALLNLMAAYRHVILVDAVAAPVGKVYRFGPGQVPPEIGYGKLSSHEWEVPDLLSAMLLYGDLPEVTIVAIGVDPLEFSGGDVGVRLGDAVRARLGALASVVLDELARLGVRAEVVRPGLAPETPFTADDIVKHA
jgi:hydrogenase maturation protease